MTNAREPTRPSDFVIDSSFWIRRSEFCQVRPRLSRRGLRTGARLGTGGRLGRAGGVEPSRQPASLARGGVLVDRVLGGHLVERLGDDPQLRFRLLPVALGQGGLVSLELVLDFV